MQKQKTPVPKQVLEDAWKQPYTGGSTRKKIEDDYKDCKEYFVTATPVFESIGTPFELTIRAKSGEDVINKATKTPLPEMNPKPSLVRYTVKRSH